ncbi:MAG: class B sortase [Ruminococcus sp.]|uniref:class B sortase n=1 Tax=Ruminococcus sp. TaxID=41978 RepID=UPI00287323E1|nr:class B sortase [Ruminococcus sp.]MBQ3285783.1 class B sortase [Ruminococcus sp.]
MKHAIDAPAKNKNKKKGKTVVLIILSVFIVGFIIGAVMLTITLLNAAREQETFNELAGLVQDTDETDEDGALRKYDELYKKNPDFFGWLKIEDTKIDYPVMYTPNDPEYYLHRDFYGNYSDSGMLFIDGDCPKDGNYYLIYGHHMNNGSMFGELPKYADIKFYEDHKTVFFDTRYELRDYEVFAAFYAKAYPKGEEEGFCYYTYKDLRSRESFDEYVSNVKTISIYETGITPVYGDELIAMSTCNYHTEDGRFVVVARRIKDSDNKAATESGTKTK